MSIGKENDSKYYKSSGKRRNTEALCGLFLSLIFGFAGYRSLRSDKKLLVFVLALLLLLSLLLLLHGLLMISYDAAKKSVVNKLIDEDNYILADFDHGGEVARFLKKSGSGKYKYYFKYRHSNGKTYLFSSAEYSKPRHFGKQAKVYVDWTRPGRMYWVSDFRIK